MRRPIKIVLALLIVLGSVLSVIAAATGEETAPETGYYMSGYSHDPGIASVDGIELITGDAPNAVDAGGKTFRYECMNLKTLPYCDVLGTDLGIPVFNSKTGQMYLMFGDTYGTNNPGPGKSSWRSNVMAITSDFDLSDGLRFDGWYQNGSTRAEAIFDGVHPPLAECIRNGLERTKIPQGGVEIDGTVYIFYESIRNFSATSWRVNYQGVIKSTDNCQTFERVYDLTWFPDINNQGNNAILAAEQPWAGVSDLQPIDTTAAPQGLIESPYKRNAPYFAQCVPVDGKDGYIYVFGRRGGKTHGIKVARVAKENIEVFAEYEYYLGNDSSGKPIWEKGYDGLARLNNDTVGYVTADVADEPTHNMTVCWNEYLGKWMLFYKRNPIYADGNDVPLYPESIGFRLSDNIWGDYGSFHTVIELDFFQPDGEDAGFTFKGFDFTEKGFAEKPEDDVASFRYKTNMTGFYGGFTHEKWQEQNGKIFYFVFSYTGIYNSALVRVTLN